MNTRRLLLVATLLVALCGAVARSSAQEGLVDLVTGLLADQDQEVRALALDQIRTEAKGEAMTRKFAALLEKFPAETQVGLLSALADRGDPAAAPSVRQLLSTTSKQSVRVAAIQALGALGGIADFQLFLLCLSEDFAPLREAARASLIGLPQEANEAMIAALRDSPAATRITLLDVLIARRARDAVPAILETAAAEDTAAEDTAAEDTAAEDTAAEDTAVRQAAIRALGELADVQHVPRMVTLVLKATPGPDRDAVERLIATVCQRHSDRQARAEPLLESMKELTGSEQVILFSTLGRIGGSAALNVVDDALQSSSPWLRDAGIRALCNWPDGSVVSRLLQVARTDENDKYKKLAFKALIRIAPLDDQRDDRRRLDTVRTVIVMCRSDADRRLVLDRAKAIRSVDTLRFVVPFLDQPPLAQQACQTVVELAHHSSLRESNRDEFHRALDEVMRISDDATVVDRARRYKAGQTWKP